MHKVFSFILSLLLLLSSTGLTYAQHYCGEFKMMEQVTIGEKHLSCGMVMEDSTCGDEHAEDHDCCDNEYTSITTDDNFAKASFELPITNTFIPALVTVFLIKPDVFEDDVPKYSEYNPPPLLKNIPVLYETFLV